MHSRFSEKWLETVCSLLPDVHSAVFMVPDQANNQLHLLACWPVGLDKHKDFLATVKYALKKRGEICFSRALIIDGQALDYFAKPVYIRETRAGLQASASVSFAQTRCEMAGAGEFRQTRARQR
jgi:hypothetical protein